MKTYTVKSSFPSAFRQSASYIVLYDQIVGTEYRSATGMKDAALDLNRTGGHIQFPRGHIFEFRGSVKVTHRNCTAIVS